MAVSLIDSPQEFTPAYNPMYWYFDSTNKTEEGFRYVVEVENFSTSEILATYKLRPTPSTGYGEVDVRKVIQQSLFNDFQTDKVYKPEGHQLRYRMLVAEEYFVNVDFTDYGFAGSGTWPNFSDASINPSGISRTMIIHGATMPPFSAGDVINVQQDNTVNYRNELEGIHTVLDVFLDTGVYYTVLDLTWIGSGGSSTGVSTYADGLKTTFASSVVGTRITAFKGAFGFLDFRNYDSTQYRLDSNTDKLLTTLPTGVRISRNMPTWLAADIVTSVDPRYLVFTIDGTEYRYALGSSTGVLNFNILPSDSTIDDVFSGGSWVAFGGGLDLTNVTQYTIQVQSISGGGVVTELSEVVTVDLYSECDKFTTYDICFLDRLGSWVTIPFNKGDYLTQNINRQTARKKYGGLNESNEWDYDSTAVGSEVYEINEDIVYRLNTGILDEVESQYMKELVSTPQAFVSIDGGNWQSIEIINSSLPLHKKRTQRDRKVSLEFKMSVQDEING